MTSACMEIRDKKKRPFVITLFGPPGSGKGTQADLLEKRFGAIHIDTGRIIEKTIYNPRLKSDPVIQRERKNFENGVLCTTEWFIDIIQNEIQKAAGDKKSIVLSGSPRTFFETERVIPFLEKLYGKNRIVIFQIHVRPETSIFRNSHRTICCQCGMPQEYRGKRPARCHTCGGKTITRSIDTPNTIRVRLKEYEKRTRPIFSYFQKRGYAVIDINGEQDSLTVSKSIRAELGKILP